MYGPCTTYACIFSLFTKGEKATAGPVMSDGSVCVCVYIFPWYSEVMDHESECEIVLVVSCCV